MSHWMHSGWLRAFARSASSIRVRIVLLAVIAIVPLLLDRVRLLEANGAEQLAASGTQALNIVRAGVDKQEDILISARSVLQTVGHAIAHIPTGSPECSRMLAEVASDVPWLKGLTVVNAQGRFVCSSKPRALGTDISDRPYFQQALQSGSFAISGFLYPRTGVQPGVVVAYGKREADGQVKTVILALVDLHWLAQLAAVVEQRPGTVALLVDSYSTVLAGHPHPDAWVGRDLTSHPLMREIHKRREGTLTALGFDGIRRIWGFLPLSNGNAYLLVGIDEREILSRIDREMTIAYGQLALVVILVLLGAWTFGEHAILRPIRALARAAERIGRGDLSIRTGGTSWAPEFLPLTRSLDSMAVRLGLREHSLRRESDRFRELAATDGLTGLSNRRAFDTELATAWQHAAALQEPTALLMMDVDHFKRYNDCYGHVDGDACLRIIGNVLAGVSHGAVRAARYGGEEFALLLPGADEAEAVRLAEVIRQTVQDLALKHGEAPTGVVTVSIGLASLTPGRADGVESLVMAADSALYASKRTRNTVTAYAPIRLAKAS